MSAAGLASAAGLVSEAERVVEQAVSAGLLAGPLVVLVRAAELAAAAVPAEEPLALAAAVLGSLGLSALVGQWQAAFPGCPALPWAGMAGPGGSLA